MSDISLRANNAMPSGRVPGSYVRLLFDYLAARGCDGAALLDMPAPRADQPTWHAAHTWRALLERAALHLRDPLLGLHLGATITPGHLGPLGYVLMASASVPAALERYVRYQRLAHDVSPVRHAIQDGQLLLEWSEESRTVGLLVNQCGMAALARFAAAIAGPHAVPAAVHFVEPEPADAKRYKQFFGCPVLFGRDATRMRFDAGMLALPPRQPDPALAALLEQQVQALCAALPRKDDWLRALRLCLSRRLLQGEPALEAVARELHVSGRTLRRRLEQQGWSFRALLADTRQRLAEDYLRDARLSLPEIALLLGYSEQSAFNRAFLGWTGVAPGRWRLLGR